MKKIIVALFLSISTATIASTTTETTIKEKQPCPRFALVHFDEAFSRKDYKNALMILYNCNNKELDMSAADFERYIIRATRTIEDLVKDRELVKPLTPQQLAGKLALKAGPRLAGYALKIVLFALGAQSGGDFFKEAYGRDKPFIISIADAFKKNQALFKEIIGILVQTGGMTLADRLMGKKEALSPLLIFDYTYNAMQQHLKSTSTQNMLESQIATLRDLTEELRLRQTQVP